MNKIILTGRLGANPELRYLPKGTAVTSFSLAVDSGYGDYERTDWFKCEILGKKAEPVNQYLNKGSKCLVEGEMICDVVEDKYYWKVKAFNVEFLDSKPKDDDEPGF